SRVFHPLPIRTSRHGVLQAQVMEWSKEKGDLMSIAGGVIAAGITSNVGSSRVVGEPVSSGEMDQFDLILNRVPSLLQLASIVVQRSGIVGKEELK
ncbi:hypothetical protein PENTCL1PPCAC_10483, partial [Pristionchus entomophagus]